METSASIPHCDHGSNGCFFSFFGQKDWSHSKLKKNNWNYKISSKKMMTTKYISYRSIHSAIVFSIWKLKLWNIFGIYITQFQFQMEKKCWRNVSTDIYVSKESPHFREPPTKKVESSRPGRWVRVFGPPKIWSKIPVPGSIARPPKNCGSGGIGKMVTWNWDGKMDETKIYIHTYTYMYTLGFQKTIKRMGGFI